MMIVVICRRVIVFSLLAVLFASVPVSASGSQVSETTITDQLQLGNVVPTWGQQIPKLVYDGKWYYAASLDGELYGYPWDGKLFKSQDGVNWTVAAQFSNQTVYQPPGLLLDHKGNLHMQVGCYGVADKPCFPGFQTNGTGAVSYHHVAFEHRLADGSADFTRFEDYSIMDSPFYYMGTAIDKTGRYIYSAYSDDAWDVRLAVFDVNKNQYIVRKVIATPPAGRAWLYPKVQPGNRPGEVHVLLGQYVLGSPNSAVYDEVHYMRSDDYGDTWTAPERVAQVDDPDGYARWVDASDIAVDRPGNVHMIYFQKSEDHPEHTLWYKDGLDGIPVGLGLLDNHAQLWIAANGERFVFVTEGAGLVVLRSADGVRWSKETYPVAGVRGIYWPTLADKNTGSKTKQHEVTMLVSGQGPEGAAFSHLLMLTFTFQPNPQGGNHE